MEKQIKIAIVSPEKIGKVMAGAAIRPFEMAKALAKDFEITLFSVGDSDIENAEFKIRSYSNSSLSRMLQGFDYVIAQSLKPGVITKIKRAKTKFVADLYDPTTIEVLEFNRYESPQKQSRDYSFQYHNFLLQLQAADHILCSSERQKDFYLGMMSALKMVTPAAYLRDPGAQNFVTVCPFGLSEENPIAKNPGIMEQKFSAITKTDKIIYWGGGIWNWFDPLTIVKAVEKISHTRQDIKLFFLGTDHPNPKIKKMKVANEVLDYCKKNGLLDKFVFFNFGWTPYEERVNYLLRSSIGISSHFDNLETRFSFRTRVLDYLWGELPIITTTGDSMADLVDKFQLGKVVDYIDVDQTAKAIEELIDHSSEIEKIKDNLREVKKQFYWTTIFEKLSQKITNDSIKNRPFSSKNYRRLVWPLYYYGLKRKINR